MNDEAIAENFKTVFHRIEAGEKRADGFDEKLNGNGRPGLCERVTAVESDLATIKRMLLAVFTVCVGILFKLMLGK